MGYRRLLYLSSLARYRELSSLKLSTQIPVMYREVLFVVVLPAAYAGAMQGARLSTVLPGLGVPAGIKRSPQP